MEEELKKWNVTAVKAQLIQFKLPANGLKEDLVKRLAASPQMKAAWPAITADPARRYGAWLINDLKNELVARKITPVGSKDDLLNLLLADLEEKAHAGDINKENQTNPVIDSIIHQLENVSLSNDSPIGKKTAQSPSRASPSKAPSPVTPPPRSPFALRQSPASSNNSPTVTFKDKTPTAISPTRLSAFAGSPKKETSPLFSKRSPVPSPILLESFVAPSTPVKTPAPTPVKSILSPRKGKQQVPGSASKRVEWHRIEIRQYKCCHGGSLGMPHRGGFPIGLDWTYDASKSIQSPLRDWEKIREPKRRSLGELAPLSEVERKQRIQRHEGKEPTLEIELESLEIRNSRTKVGCECEGDECGTEKCLCFANGIACSQDACDCAPCDCTNPSRDEFDSEKVNILRKQKIEEANRLPDPVKAPPQQNLSKLFSLTRLLQRSDSLVSSTNSSLSPPIGTN